MSPRCPRSRPAPRPQASRSPCRPRRRETMPQARHRDRRRTGATVGPAGAAAAGQGTIDDLAFGMTVMGAGPAGPPRAGRRRVARRRRHGRARPFPRRLGRAGHRRLAAPLALDRDLQPIGSFSGSLSGYDELLSALVATGQVTPERRAHRAAGARLSRQARPRRQDSSSRPPFSLQNGQMLRRPGHRSAGCRGSSGRRRDPADGQACFASMIERRIARVRVNQLLQGVAFAAADRALQRGQVLAEALQQFEHRLAVRRGRCRATSPGRRRRCG